MIVPSKELKAIDPRVKAIVSSGYSNDPVMADYRAYDLLGMIAKPFKMTALKQLLLTHLPK